MKPAENNPLNKDDSISDAPENKQETNDNIQRLVRICKDNSIEFEKNPSSDRTRFALKCGRDSRWVSVYDDKHALDLIQHDFSSYRSISGLEAIFSPNYQTIESEITSLGDRGLGVLYALAKLTDFRGIPRHADIENLKVQLTPSSSELPHIEIGGASNRFKDILGDLRYMIRPGRGRPIVTIKISSSRISTHDGARALLRKLSDAIFFQIDTMTGFALTLQRRSRRDPVGSSDKKRPQFRAQDIEYPKSQFDEVPMSLYWYARSASRMPLLQFLAYYQTIEFYFPTYSKAEARRKLSLILKDPTFRVDRDSDIAKVLSAVQVGRSGGFGDERSQLRATLSECFDSTDIRQYIEADTSRLSFFTKESKKSPITQFSLPRPTPTSEAMLLTESMTFDARSCIQKPTQEIAHRIICYHSQPNLIN